MSVKALILTGYGLNCDQETAYVFDQAGAEAHRVHINALISGDVSLADYQILAFGGGFSWGDDHGAGVVQSVRLSTHIGPDIQQFITEKKLIIGICNGFQTLVNMGLLPALDGSYDVRSAALTHNACGNFRNQWVNLSVNADSPCVFTKGIESIELPIRHGEGQFFADPEVLKRLIDAQQVVMRYARADGSPAKGQFPDNPNGSLDDIAGICDPSGRIFGLMPHPEAFYHYTNHPDWTRMKQQQSKDLLENMQTGMAVFKNAVDYFN